MKHNQPGLPFEARILQSLDEPLAAGLYEQRNASQHRRMSRGLKRYTESIDTLPPASDELYPTGVMNIWNLKETAVGWHYNSGITVNGQLLRDKMNTRLVDGRKLDVARGIAGDLENMVLNPMSTRFCVGGRGYTHSILDYRRILTDGLPEYGCRIEHALDIASDAEKCDFYFACRETFDAVMILLGKAILACENGALRDALKAVAHHPPKTFFEALVLFNFMYYIDGNDSTGALDRYLASFYKSDLDAGIIDTARAEELLGIFFANVDASNGWHMILGGEGVDEDFTLVCLRAQKTRRPNSGLKITPETSDALWETAFDTLQSGTGNPAFYNDVAYRAGAVKHAGISVEDLPYIAYGGCTEFMIEGRSQVGSIDAGLNLLRILDGTIKAELSGAENFEDFLECFRGDIRRQIGIVAEELDINQKYKATYRPQMIRTLFIEDCLDRGVEYNRGGARYNGGVVNVAGIANVANSLYAIREVINGAAGVSREQLVASLDNDFAGSEDVQRQLLKMPKFGNNVPEIDILAKEIVEYTFAEITSCRCWRTGGFLIPSTIMFVTYTGQGHDIDATPDGRNAGSAIADSCGPMQGTDLEGPTSMLTSTAILPQTHGLGTMILNLRISAGMLASPALRQKLKNLLISYFDMGGMQVQVTALDAGKLRDAQEHPEAHENLIVRIGGYTEYFNRLDKQLQQEVINRTEYL